MALCRINVSRTVVKRLKNPYTSTLVPSATVAKMNIHTNNDTKNPTDIERLSKLAADWWDPEGVMKTLHTFNIIRVPFIRDSLVTISPFTPQSTCLRGKKILDIGCGAGLLTEDLAKLGADVTGIDPSNEMIQAAVEHCRLNTSLTNKPTYVVTTIEEHVKQHSGEYDAVVASEVIEHINVGTRELFLQSCVKALKPGGKVIITTPSRTRIAQVLGIFFLEGVNIIPRGTHQYHKFSTPEELKYWLELNDCHVDLIQGYACYFWLNKWKWINSRSLMFAMRAVKLDKNA